MDVQGAEITTGVTGNTLPKGLSLTSILNICEKITRELHIPVAGIDLIVPRIEGSDYMIIEVNSRPGLDGHEPQPVAGKFIDLLFPENEQ